MPYAERIPGEYYPLTWDQDGDPPAHYVCGHVTDDEFRAAVAAYFTGRRKPPTVPVDAKIDRVYVRTVPAPAESDFDREWRHCAKGRGAFPMTVWTVSPNRAGGAS